MNQSKFKEKLILFGISMLVVVLFSIAVVYVRYSERGKVQYPISTLSLSNEGTSCIENNMFPYYYTFVDVPYMMGVPSEGASYIDGGYAYITNKDFGLVVSEYSKDRSFEGYLQDILGSLYANIGEENVFKVERNIDGYKNGFPAREYICRAKFKDHSNLIIYAYTLDAGKKNITAIALVDMPTNEKMIEIRNYLDAMTGMIRNLSRESSVGVEEISNGTADSLNDNAPSIVTETTADVTADDDYEMLRLSFVYIDVEAEIEEISIKNADGEEFEPQEMNPGEVVFLVPEVKKGDKLTFDIKAGDLSGSYVEMAEYQDYITEQLKSEEGNLHVEEEE